VNTASGVFFTWLLGLIFVVGGVVFLLFLGDNNLLFGLPYLVIGLLLCYGAWRLQKSAAKKAREDAQALDDEAVPPHSAD
jgi:membrane protein implicated in regulation of membrane protease activity